MVKIEIKPEQILQENKKLCRDFKRKQVTHLLQACLAPIGLDVCVIVICILISFQTCVELCMYDVFL